MVNNQFLLKIAKFILDTDKSLPYRKRVEVLIIKGDKILVTKNKSDDGKDSWYGFPGGGNDGKSDETTVKEECLEEVGVKVKDIRNLNVSNVENGMSDKKNRHLKFRGSMTRVYSATYDGRDSSQLGDDGDDVRYVWVSKDEAKKLLSKNKLNVKYRLEALSKVL